MRMFENKTFNILLYSWVSPAAPCAHLRFCMKIIGNVESADHEIAIFMFKAFICLPFSFTVETNTVLRRIYSLLCSQRFDSIQRALTT